MQEDRCFPVNFAKFLRTPVLTEHLWWLLLYMAKNGFKVTSIFKIIIIKCLNFVEKYPRFYPNRSSHRWCSVRKEIVHFLYFFFIQRRVNPTNMSKKKLHIYIYIYVCVYIYIIYIYVYIYIYIYIYKTLTLPRTKQKSKRKGAKI